MAQALYFSSIGGAEQIDSANGIIRGVVVMELGEAKGHDLTIDDESLNGFLSLAVVRKDGVKVRFGNDHEAGVEDTNGTLKNFRREGGKIRADLHLLKSDTRNVKLLEMAERMPSEFGLSAITDAEKHKDGKEYKFNSPLRFTQLDCVDIVSSPAATKGLFFAVNNNINQKSNMKNIALALGLPDSATEAEIESAAKLAFEAKDKMCKAEAEAEAKKKKLEAEAEADAEAKDGGKSKLAALEATVLKLSATIEGINTSAAAAQTAAHKAELENLKLEAGKDGKVIALSDESLAKLSIPEIKDMISKLPKNQVKLAKGVTLPVGKDNQPLNKRSPEFVAFMKAKQSENALALGQRMTAQLKLN